MAQYTIRICDFCKRSEDECEKLNPISRHKVKRENHHRVGGWTDLDICCECLDELRNKMRNKENQYERT